jgi:hypothetical protein
MNSVVTKISSPDYLAMLSSMTLARGRFMSVSRFALAFNCVPYK